MKCDCFIINKSKGIILKSQGIHWDELKRFHSKYLSIKMSKSLGIKAPEVKDKRPGMSGKPRFVGPGLRFECHRWL